MRRSGIVLGCLLLNSCGGPQPPAADPRSAPVDAAPDATAPRAPVSCGAATCGVDEYCEVRCTCCGMRIPDPSEASYEQSCVPLPASCHGGNPPECQQRTVQQPCA